MSHYLTLVFVPKGTDPDAHVARVMEPFRENDSGGWWDFYSIGGRWSGLLDGYQPDKDPINVERCFICAGSGRRRDMVVADGCNGCSGTGRAVKWPTEWAPHRGDVQPAEMVRDRKAPPYAIALSGEAIVGDEDVDGSRWKQAVTDAIAASAMVAVVDIHC